jgi:DNA-binding GntR family transcriptional regulator
MTYDEYIAQEQQAIDEEQPDDSCFLEYQPEGLEMSALQTIQRQIQQSIILTNKIYILMKEQVLKAMREAGKPVSAGEVAKSLNADRKEVDKAFADLKKEGAIVSPVRCKWTVA